MNRSLKSIVIVVILIVLGWFLYFFYFDERGARGNLLPQRPSEVETKDADNLYKGQLLAPVKNSNISSVSIGQNLIFVEIADTQEERSLGLGNRASLEADHGMLFVFDHPDTYGFWMKDTLIPLDIIWIDQDKKIIDIKNNILPSSYPTIYYPSSPALYVLEVNAGYAQSHQIFVGQDLKF